MRQIRKGLLRYKRICPILFYQSYYDTVPLFGFTYHHWGGANIIIRLYRTNLSIIGILLFLIVASVAGLLMFLGVKWLQNRYRWRSTQRLESVYLFLGIVTWGLSEWIRVGIALDIMPREVSQFISVMLTGVGAGILVLALYNQLRLEE